MKNSSIMAKVMGAFLAGGIIALSAVLPPLTAAGPDADDARIEEIVKQVIRENPALILETLNQYNLDRKKKLREQQLEAAFENRLSDTVGKENPRIGPGDAPITIITYTDFQCTYCSRGARTLDRLRRIYPDKLRVVFKNLPLTRIHDQALVAAQAALAAHKQGEFWAYHDLLFENSARLKDDMYAKLAAQLGLDLERFRRDMNSEAVLAQIHFEKARAAELGLNGTPRFLVNGVLIKGAYPATYFTKVIERLLKEIKS